MSYAKNVKPYLKKNLIEWFLYGEVSGLNTAQK